MIGTVHPTFSAKSANTIMQFEMDCIAPASLTGFATHSPLATHSIEAQRIRQLNDGTSRQ
jgi:hypothetical protein